MYNKILDFTNLKAIDDQEKESTISSDKNTIINLIVDEGLYGFFGVTKEFILSQKEEETPPTVV